MNRSMIWPCAVVGLLGMNATIVGITLYFASANSTMVPEPQYYERAVRFDEQVAQRAANERLGWTASATISLDGGAPHLVVRLADRSGAALSGAVVHAEVIPNARPKSRAVVDLIAAGDGYCAALPSNQAGLWTVRVEARRDGEVFTADVAASFPAKEPTR